MKRYDVWMSGYATNGNSSEAEFLGSYTALSFWLACRRACKVKLDLEDYDIINNTYWGCSFHDNEKDAREFFG